MRVGITGASGFVGGHLTPALSGRDISVVGFSRQSTAIKGVDETRNYEDYRLEDVDAVVHLAGEAILGRWTEERKKRIRKSRVEGTRNLVDAIAKCPKTSRPKILISASGVGIYGDCGDTTLTEEKSPGDGFLADVARDWEVEAKKASELGLRVVMLRIPMVLGQKGGAAELLKKVFKSGIGGKLGSGRQWMSWIHVSDLCQVIVRALEDGDFEGPVNAVAPSAVSNREFTRIAARVARRPALFPVPKPLIDVVFGEMSSVLLQSQRAIPQKLNQHGFSWKYPDLEPALADAFR